MRRRTCWVLAVLVSGCTARDTAPYFGRTTPRHGPDELWINNSTEPEWIDPGKLSDGAGAEIAWNVFAGLLQADPRTLEPTPDLAERYERLDEGLRYRFFLRPAQWSDGHPLTAADVEWSWKRVLDPKTASKTANLMSVLKGGAAFQRGELPLGRVGVRALDPETLEVELESPLPYFLYLVASYTFFPVPRHVIERLIAEGKDPDLWTRPEHIVSSGPYLLESWRFRQELRFVKNPRYWDAARVRTARIRVFEVESYNTTLNLYRTGELDWVGRNSNLPAEFMSHLEGYRDFRRSAINSVYFYWVNTRKPPLDDPQLRAALSLAVDRESLVKYVGRAGQLPTADLVPDGLAGYRGLGRPLFDPERARALLAQTAYGRSAERAPLILSYNTSEGHKQMAEAIQSMWQRHLGLQVILENQEWNTFVKRMQSGDFQIARYGWNGDYPDPFTFLELLAGTNANNSSGWSSASYDALLARANASTAAADRLALFREAEAIGLDATPLIPLYVYSRSQLVKPYVGGFQLNYSDRHPWKDLYLREEAR
ncbi:MAG: peptide ABC transporter substrate-binding protein [Deltaproteobacteria bacterium]|nr:peptide ABC transporter substrate-binding protein [Deltaproteobacteria bacterium]